MIRSLKLGLLTTAVLAISAMAASAAQAEVTFTAGETPEEHTSTPIHAVQYGTHGENYFEAGAKVSCPNANVHIDGEVKGTEENPGVEKELTVEPNYTGKCDVGNAEEKTNELVTVNMNGCHYTLTQPTKLEENTYTGEVDLVCPGAGPIVTIYANTSHTIKVCEVEISPQTGLKHIVYHNKDNGTEKDDITATVTVEGITYTNKQASCPGGIGMFEKGKYVSNLTITSGGTNAKGETFSEPDDLWISG